MARRKRHKLPSKQKIRKAEGSIAKIRSMLVKLSWVLKGNRKKLSEAKDRLRTPEQKRKYAALLKVQTALEKSTKSQAKWYKVLAGTMKKLKGMFGALAKGAKETARRTWSTAKKPVSWLASKLKRKRRPRGLRDIGDIASIDDLGVAPIVIWGAVAATTAALLVAVGSLLTKASALEEQIDALNEEIDWYEESYDEEEPTDDYYDDSWNDDGLYDDEYDEGEWW